MSDFCFKCNKNTTSCYCHPLPSWARGFNKGKILDAGAQLFTRCSHLYGNAKVIDKDEKDGDTYYYIQTDIGNSVVMLEEEVLRCFDIGPYFINLVDSSY